MATAIKIQTKQLQNDVPQKIQNVTWKILLNYQLSSTFILIVSSSKNKLVSKTKRLSSMGSNEKETLQSGRVRLDSIDRTVSSGVNMNASLLIAVAEIVIPGAHVVVRPRCEP